MAKFRIGEICEAWNGSAWIDVTVLMLPGSTSYNNEGKALTAYIVSVSPGRYSDYAQTEECYMRKKPPKAPPNTQRECDTKVSWNSCLWKPKSLKLSDER